MTDLAKTERSRVKRMHERGCYDFDSVAQILDSGFICHVAYVIDGKPYVTPTSYWREGDRLYWHGSSASRMLRAAQGESDVCLTVSLIDGLVLARSAFHHSINYRSVMLFGKALKVDDPDHKLRALESFVERMYPGRWAALRPPTEQAVKATMVMYMNIDGGSAKLRRGNPVDDDEDYSWPVWAGVVPIRAVAGTPADDGRLVPGAVGQPAAGGFVHLGLEPN